MKILAIDQARHGAWTIIDTETGKLVEYGEFNFDNSKYTFEKAVLSIERLIDGVINTRKVSAVFIEDIQLRQNVQSFKRLAQLQGVLVNLFEKNEYLYGVIAPTQWQNFCKARGRSEKEISAQIKRAEDLSRKSSKVLSLEFVKDNFGIETENDNLADSICIAHYVACNYKFEKDKSGKLHYIEPEKKKKTKKSSTSGKTKSSSKKKS